MKRFGLLVAQVRLAKVPAWTGLPSMVALEAQPGTRIDSGNAAALGLQEIRTVSCRQQAAELNGKRLGVGAWV